ncbi:MAG: hypothetical protein PHQ27_07220 [Victivallales bacterium]|nr:hypothetical protein [Victivallales bacterium]
MVEKTMGGLKHYRRKKFVYKFFLRRSAVNGAWFGVTWCALLSLLSAYLLLFTLPLVGTDFLSVPRVIPICLGGTALLLYLYGVVVLGLAYRRMVRRCPVAAWWRNPAGAVALVYPLGGLVLAPLMIRRKCWWGAVWSIASLGLLLSVLVWWHEISPDVSWGMIWGGILALPVAIAGWREQKTVRQWRYLWPLAVMLLFWTGMFIYSLSLAHDLHRDRAAISHLVGHAVALEDFWARQRQGLSYDDEPLRTLIATKPHLDADWDSFSWVPAQPTAFYRHQRAVFRRYPKFMAAAEAFLTLPVQTVGHPHTDIITEVLMPELSGWHHLAVYLSCDLIAHASDLAVVRQRNAELERVRDWYRSDLAFISQAAGMRMERMRLQALAYPLATGTVSPAEWQRLVGPEVDWRTGMVTAVGDEVTTFQSIYRHVIHFKPSGNEDVVYESGDFNVTCYSLYLNMVGIIVGDRKDYPPLAVRINAQRNYRHVLNNFHQFLRLLTTKKLTSLAVYQRAAALYRTLEDHLRLQHSVLFSSITRCCFLMAASDEFRRVALMAGEVEQYRRKHGGLPESLSFLPPTRPGSPPHLPVIYEHGDLEVNTPGNKVTTRYGFRLYLLDWDGRDPGGRNAENAFTVLLPRPEKP